MPRKYKTRRSRRLPKSSIDNTPMTSILKDEVKAPTLDPPVLEREVTKPATKPATEPVAEPVAEAPAKCLTLEVKKKEKKPRKANKWIEHVRATRKKNPSKTYKECMQIAKTNYKR